jgi:hypothetical protein
MAAKRIACIPLKRRAAPVLEDKLKCEIGKCEAKLGILNEEIANQLKKGFLERDGALLLFLTKEKSIYDYALKLLLDLKKEL